MNDIQQYLFEVDKNKKEATAIAERSARRLESKELKLVELIQSLGDYISHDEFATRAKTMSYVAEVLRAIPSGVLTGQQRNLLCDFVITRIADDNEVIGASAKALLALEERGKWGSTRATQIMTVLLDHTQPLNQYKQQSERYSVVMLIDRLMARYRLAIQDLHQKSSDFLPRFISYFDGEKDPRNLMVIFSILQVPAMEWDVSACAQELFDAAFNYFPITFRPPPDDPYHITAQDLKDRLRACIAASSRFAPYAFPALLDKLDSTSTNTKRDVLQALFDCVSNYHPDTVAVYAITLWNALKFEILHAQEEDLLERTLETIAQLAAQLTDARSPALATYLKPVAKECNEQLEDAPTKQSQAAARILRSVASASTEACNILIASVLPHIFLLCQATDSFAKKRSLVECISELFRANIKCFGDWRSIATQRGQKGDSMTTSQLNNALQEFNSRSLDLLRSNFLAAPIKEVSYRLALLDALMQLANVRGLLNGDSLAGVVSLFTDVVVSEESYGKDEMKIAAVNAIVDLAHQKPQLIIDRAFPAFLAKLPDKDDEGSGAFVSILEAFAKLGGEPRVFDTVILRLKNRVAAAVQSQASNAYIEALLSAILYAISQRTVHREPPLDFNGCFHGLVVPLIKRVAVDMDAATQSDAAFYLIGRLCNVILRNASIEDQQNIAQHSYTLYLEHHVDQPPPFSMNSTSSIGRRIIVSTYILASLRRDVRLPIDIHSLVACLAKFALKDSISVGTRVGALQQLSLVMNKFVAASNVRSALEPILHGSVNLLSPQNLSPNSIRIMFALVKGLVLRNAPTLDEIFTLLLTALSDECNGRFVAHGFSTILQPDEILTKDNFCIVSALHKQKTFTLLASALADRFRTAEGAVKANHLVALAGILRWLPYNILEPQLPSLVPLLLQTLDLDGEDDVKAGTIDTIISILRANPTSLEGHAASLITRLLSASDSTKTQSPKVRSEALSSLSVLCGRMRREVVVPFRRQVVKRLVAALDDRKRSVRAEAVRCRSKWIDLDEAGDEDA